MAAGMLLAMVAAFGLVQAPDPGIGKWIRKLGDDDIGIREEAVQRLQRIGGRALPALDKAGTSPDAEVAGAARALAALNRKDIRIKEVCPPPRRVSIRAKALTIGGAARLVAEESGYRLEVWREAAGVAIDGLALEDVPFWEAVAELARRLPPSDDGQPLFPVWSDRDGASLGIGGPCRYATDGAVLVALSVRKSKSLNLACHVEPGRKEAFAIRGELLEFLDGKGEAIPVRSRVVKWELPRRWQHFAFGLRAPLPPRLARVRVRFAVYHALVHLCKSPSDIRL